VNGPDSRPVTVSVFMFCCLLYSAPVMFLHDSVTFISMLMIMIIIIIIIIIIK